MCCKSEFGLPLHNETTLFWGKVCLAEWTEAMLCHVSLGTGSGLWIALLASIAVNLSLGA